MLVESGGLETEWREENYFSEHPSNDLHERMSAHQ